MSASSTDRVIVITGAARGIGIEWVKQYAKEQTFIVAVVRSPESATELKKLAGDKIVIVKGDMEQPETFDAVAQEIAKYTGGRVDLLIDNAGAWFGAGATPGKQITASTPGEWTRTFQLNTIGPIFFTKAMIPQIQKGTEKRVVNIGSFLGSIDFHKATQAYAYVSYSAAKLALSFATLKYAQEFPTITFIDLNPGFVGTELHNVGREHAPLTTEQSVLRCKSFVDRVTTADSGEAFSLDGLREMVAA